MRSFRLVPLLLFGFFLLLADSSQGASTPSSDATQSLSPYFLLEDGAESNVENFPLLETQVEADISGVIAQVRVRQRYANRGNEVIHARYIFPGSTRAAVHGLQMTIGDRVVRAQIKEREEARQTFETARREGKSASLLEQQRPNVFSMQVTNILPGDQIEVELTYTELLVPKEGVYSFVYPTVVGPRYNDGKESDSTASNQSWVANPYLKKGRDPQTIFDIRTHLNAGMPLQDVSCPTHQVQVSYASPEQAVIKLEGSDGGGNRDYILRYRLTERAIASGLLLYEGKDENFFLLMAQPPERPLVANIPKREYIFVIDVSGSMSGFPLDTSKKLLKDLLGSLRAEDRFNILFFAGASDLLASQSLPATADEINRALNYLDQYQGGGGTELREALVRAMTLPVAGEDFSRSLVVITDGYISAEEEVFDRIRKNLNHSNLFAFGIGSSVNRYLIEGLAKAGRGEPFILTDPAESVSTVKHFKDYIASPVLTNIKVDYTGFDAYDLEPAVVPDLFAQRPVLIFGKWRGERKGTITVSGTSGDSAYKQSFALGEVKPQDSNAGLRFLWARERLAQLSDYRQNSDNGERKKDIVALGLRYTLLSAHTSFVAVDEVVRNLGGVGKDKAQPLVLPAGVPDSAIGDGMAVMPEPEFWLLLALALLVLAVRLRSDQQESCRSKQSANDAEH